jgi:hypothetical protein
MVETIRGTITARIYDYAITGNWLCIIHIFVMANESLILVLYADACVLHNVSFLPRDYFNLRMR